jgi:hypothetical protein
VTPELKAKWVAALRSGQYQQARERMKAADGALCCLGVLCVISGVEPIELSAGQVMVGDGNAASYDFVQEQGLVPSVFITLNDKRKWSFAQIADYIEANVS